MGVSALGGIWQVSFHVTGTLSADLNIRWTAPCDCTLLHASAVSSDANAFGINIGDSSDTDEYLQKSSAGVSNTPVEFDGDDWYNSSGVQPGIYYPHITDGTIIVIEVDFNYNGGGSAAASDDPTIVLTFAEG